MHSGMKCILDEGRNRSEWVEKTDKIELKVCSEKKRLKKSG